MNYISDSLSKALLIEEVAKITEIIKNLIFKGISILHRINHLRNKLSANFLGIKLKNCGIAPNYKIHDSSFSADIP